MKTKSIAITILVLSVFNFRSFAGSQEIDELLEVMRVRDQMTAGFDAMLPVIQQLATQWNLDAEGTNELADIYRDWWAEDIDQDHLVSEIGKMYESSYTTEELQILIDFYKTPVGQKTLKLMPELTARGAELGMKEAESKQTHLLNRLQVFLEKHGIK